MICFSILKPLFLKKMRLISISFLLFFFAYYASAQDSTSVKKRLKPLVIGSSTLYAGSLIALNELWYADFERQSFQFFNDNAEWKQVDKIGHFYSAFHISAASYHGLKWAGLEHKKSVIWGALVSTIVLTPIEIFDGFSAQYGASYGDLIANTTGGLFFAGQQLLWNEIRIHPKFSFNRSAYASLRPEILGQGLKEEILKDYNAQTYWLSFDMSKFNSFFPKWLNLGLGYGAKEMIFANDRQNQNSGFEPQRQFYVGLDIDISNFESKSRVVNTLIYIINLVRIPAPALEFSDGNFRFHSFHY